jgi:hypothetical protein
MERLTSGARLLSMQQKGVSMTISSSLNAGVAGLSGNATLLAAKYQNMGKYAA